MPITREKIENLLFEDEGSTLDFKRDQYPFNGANEHQKAELLKDILAFSNAWRRTDAYILIGVEETKGGKSEIVGVSHHLDDANLQQFVNQKTQRPVGFSYETMEIENKQIGIIHIPIQERPIFLKQNYARLGKNIIYIRRGSSTDEANPDEVIKMGEDVIASTTSTPIIELQFGKATGRSLHGKSIELKTTILTIPSDKQIEKHIIAARPRMQTRRRGARALDSILSSNPLEEKKHGIERIFYFEKLAKHLREIASYDCIHIVASNVGATVGQEVQLEIEVKDPKGIFYFKDECYMPQEPQDPYPYKIPDWVSRQNTRRSSFFISRNSASWHIKTSFQKILPKQNLWTGNRLFIEADESTKLSMPVKIFAANLPNPIEVELMIDIQVSQKELTLEELFGGKI